MGEDESNADKNERAKKHGTLTIQEREAVGRQRGEPTIERDRRDAFRHCHSSVAPFPADDRAFGEVNRGCKLEVAIPFVL